MALLVSDVGGVAADGARAPAPAPRPPPAQRRQPLGAVLPRRDRADVERLRHRPDRRAGPRLVRALAAEGADRAARGLRGQPPRRPAPHVLRPRELDLGARAHEQCALGGGGESTALLHPLLSLRPPPTRPRPVFANGDGFFLYPQVRCAWPRSRASCLHLPSCPSILRRLPGPPTPRTCRRSASRPSATVSRTGCSFARRRTALRPRPSSPSR